MSKPTVGEVITWSVRNCFLRRDDLVAALAAAKFDVTVKTPEKRTYLLRALHQSVRDGIIRPIGEDTARVSYAIIDETSDFNSQDWEASMREAVTLDKTTGEVTFKRKTPLSTAICAAIRQNEGGLVGQDVGAAIKRCVTEALDGIALRDGGGVYFVPEMHAARLTDLEKALATVVPKNATVRIHRMRIITGVREQADLIALFADTVMDEANKMHAEAQNAFREDGTRPSTFRSRIASIGGLIDFTKKYEQVLDAKLPTLRNSLTRMRLDVLKCLQTAFPSAPVRVEKGKKSKKLKAKKRVAKTKKG